MAAPKGHTRYGGRQKGIPNKKTQSLLDKVEASGFDPFEALLKFAQDPDPDMAFQALKEVCQYIYPKRKAIEHTGTDGGPIQVEFNPYKDMSEEELDKCLEQGRKK